MNGQINRLRLWEHALTRTFHLKSFPPGPSHQNRQPFWRGLCNYCQKSAVLCRLVQNIPKPWANHADMAGGPQADRCNQLHHYMCGRQSYPTEQFSGVIKTKKEKEKTERERKDGFKCVTRKWCSNHPVTLDDPFNLTRLSGSH